MCIFSVVNLVALEPMPLNAKPMPSALGPPLIPTLLALGGNRGANPLKNLQQGGPLTGSLIHVLPLGGAAFVSPLVLRPTFACLSSVDVD